MLKPNKLTIDNMYNDIYVTARENRKEKKPTFNIDDFLDLPDDDYQWDDDVSTTRTRYSWQDEPIEEKAPEKMTYKEFQTFVYNNLIEIKSTLSVMLEVVRQGREE